MKGDPYWTTAKFNGNDDEGNPVKKGDRIFYWPRMRLVQTGAKAEQSARTFAAAVADEDFYNH